MLAAKLLSAVAGATGDKPYVDDVFSAYTYTGNGSTQTINNGIDLAGKGGVGVEQIKKCSRSGGVAGLSQGHKPTAIEHNVGAVDRCL